MEMQWVKLDTGMFDNKKLKYIRNLERGNEYALVWVQLLCLAGKCGTSGRLELCEGVPFDVPMLADELGFDADTVREALELFDRLCMIDYDNGTCFISDWEEHQAVESIERKRGLSRERKRRQRERDRECDAQEDCHANVTRDCHANVTRDVTQMSRVTSRDCHATEKSREEKSREEVIDTPVNLSSEYGAGAGGTGEYITGSSETDTAVPDHAEVVAYIECNYPHLDAEEFWDYYAVSGWRDSHGNPVVDWKAAVRKHDRNRVVFDHDRRERGRPTVSEIRRETKLKPKKPPKLELEEAKRELGKLRDVPRPKVGENTLSREQLRKRQLEARIAELERQCA